MKSFKEIYEAISASKRVGIQHLNQMKPIDFIRLVKFLKDQGGKINDTNAETSVKVDGFGLRFGLDKDNNFFIESSNSGPQFKAGAFSQYTIDKHGENNPISVAYDTLFDVLSKNKKLINILKENNTDSGIKIISECLYNPIGNKTGNNIQFVAIKYELAKLGNTATFVLFGAQDGNGNNLDKSLLTGIKDLSNKDYKFTDANISTEGVDLSIEISDVLKFIKKYPDWETKVVSRKKVDKEIKELLKRTLKEYQDKMASKILGMVKDPKFGQEFEGIVVKILNGETLKVIHNDFSSRKNKKYRPK